MLIRTIVSLATVSVAMAGAPVVKTPTGPVSGVRVNADVTLNAPVPQPVDYYLGIPFAQPPVGELRFRPPKPITNSWTEPLVADKQPPKCVSASGGQEDCLYLNVYAPSSASSNPRPVMIWIYGGGFNSGSIRSYNGVSLAASEDVIVVMGNYRLGVLGFLTSDWTMEESGTTGNWGLLDQRAVFQWVQDNISAFGGDPSRVTIFGESAGAMSVVSHLVAEPYATGLFSSAIIQSGTTHVNMFFQPREDVDKYHEWYASTHLNCPGGLKNIECLRRVPASRFVISASERDGWGAPTWANPVFPMFSSSPVIDGVFLKASPMDLVKAGKIMPGLQSVIIGTTQDEGSVFATQLGNIIRPGVSFPPLEEEMYRIFSYIMGEGEPAISTFMTEDLPKFKEAYPVNAERPGFREADFQFVSSVIRNLMFACPTVTFADLLTGLNIPTYVYNFDFNFWPEASRNFPVGAFMRKWGDMIVSDLGAFHSSDVPFVMKLFLNRNITINDITIETPYALYMAPAFAKPGDMKHRVSDTMSCFWANLAKCGAPICAESCGVTWERYDSKSRNFLLFGRDGTFETKQVRASGDMVVGEAFPTADKCNSYMTIPSPFHDLRADLGLTGSPSKRVDWKRGNGVLNTSQGLISSMMLIAILALYI